MTMRKTLITIVAFIALLFPTYSAYAINQVDVYLFWGDGCPHCAKEKEFLKTVTDANPHVVLHQFEIYYDAENVTLLQNIAKELNIDVKGIPLTIIGNEVIEGFSEFLTPAKINARINYCRDNTCPDSVASFISAPPSHGAPETQPGASFAADTDTTVPDESAHDAQLISVPFLGTINPTSLSLPVLTIALGALDGFNPCAMWTLLFLISMLIGMKDRKRMWILGSAFIAASALVYFLFMAAWLNLILFLGFIIWVRIAIGLVAVAGGTYNLKEFFTNKTNTCKVTASDSRQRTFDKIKAIVQKDSFYLALVGIILLAFAVNLVELICSAGLPAVYTQVLALSNLDTWQYYLYIALYVFVFMLDDLIIFFVAMTTLKITGLTGKYTRISHLIGGVLMVGIGLLLIFAPQALMFG